MKIDILDGPYLLLHRRFCVPLYYRPTLGFAVLQSECSEEAVVWPTQRSPPSARGRRPCTALGLAGRESGEEDASWDHIPGWWQAAFKAGGRLLPADGVYGRDTHLSSRTWRPESLP